MSQQLLQQETRQVPLGTRARSASPSRLERPAASVERRRARQAVPLPLLRGVGLASAVIVTALLLALVYATGWARLTKEDHLRQKLEAETENLRADNVRLGFALDLAHSPQYIAEVAQQAGMRLADPATELDQAILPGAKQPAAVLAAKGERGLGNPPLKAGIFSGLLARHP